MGIPGSYNIGALPSFTLFNLCLSTVVVALSSILAYITCLLILIHMIGSIRYIIDTNS